MEKEEASAAQYRFIYMIHITYVCDMQNKTPQRKLVNLCMLTVFFDKQRTVQSEYVLNRKLSMSHITLKFYSVWGKSWGRKHKRGHCTKIMYQLTLQYQWRQLLTQKWIHLTEHPARYADFTPCDLHPQIQKLGSNGCILGHWRRYRSIYHIQ